MRVLLVSTYELGHQPLHLASPAAALRRAGHEVRTPRPRRRAVGPGRRSSGPRPWLLGADAHRHAAGAPGRRRVRREPGRAADLPLRALRHRQPRPDPRAGTRRPRHRRRVRAGARGLGRQPGGWGPPPAPRPRRSSRSSTCGARSLGPPARGLCRRSSATPTWRSGGEERLVGYVEASHGCLHRCRHCPVPVVYDGRIRIVPDDVVLADVERLVERRRPPHHLRRPRLPQRPAALPAGRAPRCTSAARADLRLHGQGRAHPAPRRPVAGAGRGRAACSWSAPSRRVNDDILAGSTRATRPPRPPPRWRCCARHGIEIRPSFLPFTPWTTLDDVADIVDFVAAHDLVANVDPVQYTIRLLVPEGSLLWSRSLRRSRLGPYDAERLSWTWSARPTPPSTELQTRLARHRRGRPDRRRADRPDLRTGPGRRARRRRAPPGRRARPAPPERLQHCRGEGRPRLTEPWFC